MILEIIKPIFMWMIYLISGITFTVAFYFLFKIVFFARVKKLFKKKIPYKNKEILEEDPFWEKGKR